MKYTIALAGNPNSGKTTLFNELTGSTQRVGNWPGVTVDKKEGNYKKNKDIVILDLPGTYSLSPYSQEEVLARNYIVKERPHAVINIVDATNIERNLYLSIQILETKIPTIIALNMMDEVEARGDIVNPERLSKLLGVKVVPITARNGKGLDKLMEAVEQTVQEGRVPKELPIYDDYIKSGITGIKELLTNEDETERTWKSIKLLEGDEIVGKEVKENKEKISSIVSDVEKKSNQDLEAKIADLRYKFIEKIVKESVKKKHTSHVETTSDKLDKILTNRFLAFPLFALIMYAMFSITFGEGPLGIGVWLQTIVVDFWEGPLTETIVGFIEGAGASDWALSLVQDGILAGLGGIISFLPQILVLFLLMSFMEDSGYMARVAFVMDKVFRKFGLSGKSFIPLLMGFGCSVPALMASRTLENEKERRLTMMITPFMSCGAKLPIYLMFAVTLFPNDNQALIIYSIYFLGLIVAILSGIILSKTLFKGNVSNFVMELPQYRVPTLKSILIHAWDKLKDFAIRAGTVIFASTVFIWLLANFNFSGMVEMDESFLAHLGNGIKIVFEPLGFGNWRAAVGTITGFIAKENIVSTFGVLFGASDEIIEAASEGSSALPGISDVFTRVSAFSYMAFNLLCMPCFAAVGAIKKEMNSMKWTLGTIAFQMVTAWIVSFLIFQIGSLIF